MAVQETRQFGIGGATVRISDASTHTVERIITWEPMNNDYNLLDYGWTLHNQAPPTEVDTGVIYTHVDGVRMHASMTFSYWHPDYETDRNGIRHQSFTEHDFAWLLRAQCGTAYDIEFFPFDTVAQGTPPNSKYHCHIISLTRTRAEGNAYVWNCSLEVEGVNIVTAGNIPVS